MTADNASGGLPPICTPLTLSGRHVSLKPLRAEHAKALADAARDGELWALWYTTVPSPEGMEAEIARRLELQSRGSMLPFTVFDADGRAVGMTTYMNIDATHQRVEIGSTWYAGSVQRTPLNTEAKRLLLAHAFESLQCIAVEFRTHRLNRQSRQAIERLGHSLTASCAITSARPMAPCATPRSTASPPLSGRRCARISTSSCSARAERG